MVNLDLMLQYQRLDIERKKIMDEIEGHEFSKRLDRARSEFNLAKTQVNDSEKEAESIVSFFNSSSAVYEDLSKRTAVLEAKINELSDAELDELKDVIAQLESLRDKMADLEKKLTDKRSQSEAVIHHYVESQDRGKKVKIFYNEYKQKLDALKAEKAPKIMQVNKEMEALLPKIDPSLMSQYNVLTSENKYPALVEASTADGGRNYSCCGCGLSLSQKSKSEYIEKSICRCENCRRIIYNNKSK